MERKGWVGNFTYCGDFYYLSKFKNICLWKSMMGSHVTWNFSFKSNKGAEHIDTTFMYFSINKK